MFRMSDKISNGDVYIIAEMSANHGGSLENALNLVREVAKTGADCLKIQTYTADTMTIDCENDYFKIKGGLWNGYSLYELYKEAYTPWEWQCEIKRECERYGLDFLSTPFDASSVDFLEELGCEAYKIASFELVDIPLIEYTAAKHKPMIISCGMGSLEEIREALDACKRVGNTEVILLKCCSEYPANWSDMHLRNIPDMKEHFGVNIGISDHSMGSVGAVVGVTLGACVVEKHICISRSIPSPDSAFSMEIDEFKSMVEDIRKTKLMLQGPDYTLTKGEQDSTKFRRSLFAVKDIKKGEVYSTENVKCIRPSNGLKPKFLKDIIGKCASKDYQRGMPIEEKL